MSDGERVERLISDWLERNYPDGPTWYGRPATVSPALEIKMIPAFGEIEYNLSNGGGRSFYGTASALARDYCVREGRISFDRRA